VKLLCELGLFEDAVSLALDVDLDLAKAVANTPEDDDGLRRKLWLSIAKHVVQGGTAADGAGGPGTAAAAAGSGSDDGPEQAERIKMAVEFLKEAGGPRHPRCGTPPGQSPGVRFAGGNVIRRAV
jgi:hypothetical protein